MKLEIELNPKMQTIEIPTIKYPAFQSEACRCCANNPLNGGSGICHCTLGIPKITC